jgi:restriction system protein
MKIDESRLLDATKLNLDEWLALLKNRPKGKIFIDNRFPSPRHSEEFLASVKDRPETEVKALLRHFLMKSGTLPFWDSVSLQGLILTQKQNPKAANKMLEFEHYKRLVIHRLDPSEALPWEGNTWVLDLLPHFPQRALDGLDAYIQAHSQFLPDIARYGLYDAAEIIRARYIGLPGTHGEALDFLASLDPRQFECVAERLYHEMGYETELTPLQKDGGRDINAHRKSKGQRERLLIECKLYSRPVGVEYTRRLLGSVGDARYNRGVLVSNNKFTRGAKEFAARNSIELIDGTELVPLLNRHLGPKWPLHIERLVQESLKTAAKASPLAEE